MGLPEFARVAGQVAVYVAAVLLAARFARVVARPLLQPPVIAEITVGLLAGPAVLLVGGREVLDVVLPADVSSGLRVVGHIGVVLFIVGVAHHLRDGPDTIRGRTVSIVAAGALLAPLAAGGILAAWVLSKGGPALRGHAPAPSLALLVAVSLSVTAVPVLARILADRGLADQRLGRLAMSAAVIIDVIAWMLLALAIGLAAGAQIDVLRRVGVLAAGILGAVVLLVLLRAEWAGRICLRSPRIAAVCVAAAALLVSDVMRRGGLTEIFGALLVGFAIPPGRGQWGRAVADVARVGRWLVPVFFVSTGITVFGRDVGSTPWTAIVLATALAIAGKVGGTCVAARLAGETAATGLRLGVLLNTRGLTELVVLQVGYSAGILTPALYLALVVMALVTTAMTGPADSLLRGRAGAATKDEGLLV